ncbi:MAG TPA: SigE family RNA polymerase sigma factor [Streptosporangiaceae bacterium]
MSEDAAAFAAFVRANSRSLYGTAYLLTGDQDAAEELVQDTLVRLHPKWVRVAAAESPLAYVRRALINGFVSQRRRAASRELPLWDPPDAADVADVADVAEAVSTRRTLVTLLAGLPARQRAALVMRYLYDLPDTEIATALGCRVATVRSIVSRGITTLHQQHLRAGSATGHAARGEL